MDASEKDPVALPSPRARNAKRPDHGKLPLLGVGLLLGLLSVGIASFGGLWGTRGPKLPAEVTPLKAPLLKDLPEFNETYRDEMHWGSYRSGLYFGMRTRDEPSLQVGLMWFDPDDPATITERKLRHEASQDDKLASYGWLRHDGRSFGRQQLLDGAYNITLSMAKQFTEDSGRGGDWAVRLAVQRTQGAGSVPSAGRRQRRISLLLYLVDDLQQDAEMEVLPDTQMSVVDPDGGVLLRGTNGGLGDWALSARASGTGAAATLNYFGTPFLHLDDIVSVKPVVFKLLTETAQVHHRAGRPPIIALPDTAASPSNLAMFQLTFELPGSFDFTFLTRPDRQHDARVARLAGEPLSRLLDQREADFDARFDARFPHAHGAELDEPTLEVARAAVSNLLGSMGYFHGVSKVLLPGTGEEVDSWPSALYTAVPSRSFFPRGFLWDEGFHQLLVQRWDGSLSRDALAHWLDLVNAQGWIPREQILGAEARARVPEPYILQRTDHGNPPSLILPILHMAQRIAAAVAAGQGEQSDGEAGRDLAFLTAAWPRLEAWYGWFNRTQTGPVPGSYRWHGRDAHSDTELNPKTLMSGLDDYPRASHPTDEERHLDLRCWMALASRAMATIGTAIRAPPAAIRHYEATAAMLSDLPLLNRLHRSEAGATAGMYLDYGLHTEDVTLESHVITQDGQPRSVQLRVVGTPPRKQLVPSFGYVSLFPLLTWLLPADSAELGQQLALLQRSELLWSRAGLRSLATTSSLYKQYNTETDPPYWRGQVWININYLTLRALHHYGAQEGPHRQLAARLYQELRTSVLGNLVQQYHRSGYLWERYDDDDGTGLSSHPFTGWTALVTLIATETY